MRSSAPHAWRGALFDAAVALIATRMVLVLAAVAWLSYYGLPADVGTPRADEQRHDRCTGARHVVTLGHALVSRHRVARLHGAAAGRRVRHAAELLPIAAAARPLARAPRRKSSHRGPGDRERCDPRGPGSAAHVGRPTRLPGGRRRTVWLYAVLPTGFFLSAPYAESLLFLALVAAFVAADGERWLRGRTVACRCRVVTARRAGRTDRSGVSGADPSAPSRPLGRSLRGHRRATGAGAGDLPALRPHGLW